MKIKILNKKKVLKNITQLKKIDRYILDEPWGDYNFLLELEGKWKYSFIAVENNNIIGFIICSIKKENGLHIHRIAILPEYQRERIGSKLIENLFAVCSDPRISHVTVNTKKDNKAGQMFYIKNGFKFVGTEGFDCIFEKVMT